MTGLQFFSFSVIDDWSENLPICQAPNFQESRLSVFSDVHPPRYHGVGGEVVRGGGQCKNSRSLLQSDRLWRFRRGVATGHGRPPAPTAAPLAGLRFSLSARWPTFGFRSAKYAPNDCFRSTKLKNNEDFGQKKFGISSVGISGTRASRKLLRILQLICHHSGR